MMAALSRMFPWGYSLVNGEAGYADPMAAQRISVGWRWVQTNGKTLRAQGPPEVDPRDGGGKPDLVGPKNQTHLSCANQG
jgi:hypothetical protein